MSLPEEMTVIGVSGLGGPDVLIPEKRPVPEPGRRSLLIQVAAAGVNRTDTLQRQGHVAPAPGASLILGLEAAGQVAAVGPDVRGWRPGDQVTALLNGGGYAEYAVADEGTVFPVPAGLSLVEAAALPETAMTVWSNVFERGRLRAGETLLVHGGTSGIGTMAIQLAAARGSTVIATAGSDDKCATCVQLGAAHAINYRTNDFVRAVLASTGGRGANLVLDMVGGDYTARNVAAAATDGRIVQIGLLGGSQGCVDLAQIMSKRLTLTGSRLRGRDAAFKGRLARTVEVEIWRLIADGTVRPVIDSTFPLASAAAAHARMESNAHVGKILLVV